MNLTDTFQKESYPSHPSQMAIIKKTNADEYILFGGNVN
jgi:hypothetical protein